MTLQVGDMAPDFTLLNENEEPVRLSELRGKKIVLYFYPKDMTPGCTKEACDFRDAFSTFKDKNTLIFGISKDKSKSHLKFIEKHQLPFSLLIDGDAKVCTDYQVINPKSMFGKTFLGIKRSTFLIDEKGVIRAIWRGVKVDGHIEQILNEIK